MSDSIISVENLSKKYVISHKKEQRYTAMRDVLVNGAKNLGKRLVGKQRESSSKEDFWALKDINFEIKQGDRVGIIGRNGAGKSTLLKILSRITEPTTGKIHLKGRVASLLEVGTGFHPELTGRENIFLNGAIMGMSKWEIKKKFDEIVAFAEVEKFLDTPVKRYSSGMYVRLAFAVAAHLEPEILIVDEVLAVGDAQFQKKCLGKMEDVGKEGRTVIFVSHNMGSINQLCETGLYLNKGSIGFKGELKNCIRSYFNHTNCNEKIKIDSESNKAYIQEVSFSKTNLEYFDITEEIELNLSLKVIVEKISICIAIYIKNEYGDTVLFSRDIESIETSMRSKGNYKYSIRIPEKTLAPGKYRISVDLAELNSDVIQNLSDIILFEVKDYLTVRAKLGLVWYGNHYFFPKWSLESKSE